MPKIIEEGCVVSCASCQTKLSFLPSEVSVTFHKVAAGYSPEEEAYEKPIFNVGCPKCSASVDVDKALGPEGKRAAEKRAREALKREDHDL